MRHTEFDRRKKDRGQAPKYVEEEEQAALDATHAGFRVTCLRCGSHSVGVTSDVGFAEPYGGWGSVDLVCAICAAKSVLVQNK